MSIMSCLRYISLCILILNIGTSYSEEFPKLDLVFVMDVTSSMSPYIDQGKESIVSIAQNVVTSEKALVQFAYIPYRDHPPQDHSFVTQVHDFTASFAQMKQYTSLYDAEGGGDGPEAVTQALYEALNSLSYRKNSAKIVVLIADAPPHGLPNTHSHFPNGNPNGHDPIKIAKEMARKGIQLYVAGAERNLAHYQNARDFLAGLARITDGNYLPLSDAKLLADVIIANAQQEISFNKIKYDIAAQMKQLKKDNPNWSDEQIQQKIYENLKEKDIKIKQSELGDVYDGKYDESNILNVVRSADFSEAKSKLKVLKQPEMRDMHAEFERDSAETMGGILMLDVTPLSIGIDNNDGKMIKIIERNSVIPTKKSKSFLCNEMGPDEDGNILIKLYQGEITNDVSQNILLGNYELRKKKDDKVEECVIQIEIVIDVNGVINVSENGNKIISIDAATARPSQEQIDEMLIKARKYGDIGGTSQKNELFESGITSDVVERVMGRAVKEEL
eukprot:52033_1